jgi:hypothetical protein
VNQAWIGLIGALAGVTVTAAATITTSWLAQRGTEQQRRQERQDARRKELQQIYVAFLLAAQRFYAHVSTLDLEALPDLRGEKALRAQLERLVDPTIRTSLEESGTTAQLLSGEGLYDVLSTFLNEVLNEALVVALTGQPERGGYDELAKPLLRSMRTELNVSAVWK